MGGKCRAHYRRVQRGRPVEGAIRSRTGGQRKVNLRVPREVWTVFEDEANQRGISVYEAMKQGLKAYADSRKKRREEEEALKRGSCPTCGRISRVT